MKDIWKKIKKNKTFLILLAIVAVGIFLRTYHFHDWLVFNLDQIRDAVLVEKVIAGEIPWPLLGPHMNHTEFQMGPVYYYFQIFSAKIFGIRPESFAYPDLFFSLLSIPLFYFFLRRYFSEKASLAFSALYVFSFYALTYSRFAWNSNSIPFFSLLFLLSLHEFLTEKEKTRWFWVLLGGIASGVGVQLHAILLILMPITFLAVFVFTIKSSRKAWIKCLAMLALALFINSGQIASEMKTGFSNSKLFLSTLGDKTGNEKNGPIKKFEMNIDCHVQSNANIIASLGNSNDCDFFYTKEIAGGKNGRLKKMETLPYIAVVVFSTAFSLLGYAFLIYFFRKEKDKKRKYFLGLIILYSALSFLVLLPVGNDLRPRYFMHVFFIPFLFLGLFYFFLAKTKLKKYSKLFLILFLLFFALANAVSIKAKIQELSSKMSSELDSGYDSIVLGEIEPMVDYIISEASQKKEAYIYGKATYIGTFFEPLAYIGDKKDFSLKIGGKDGAELMPKEPCFYMANGAKNSECLERIGDYDAENCKIFGNIAIYKVKSQ